MRKLLLAATALIALTGTASADIVTLGQTSAGTPIQWNTAGMDNLQLTATVPGGNQPRNVACLICGANQPQQPTDFGYNDFGNKGNGSNISAFSSGVFRDKLDDNVIGTGYTLGSGSLFLPLCWVARTSVLVSTSTTPARRRHWRASGSSI